MQAAVFVCVYACVCLCVTLPRKVTPAELWPCFRDEAAGLDFIRNLNEEEIAAVVKDSTQELIEVMKDGVASLKGAYAGSCNKGCAPNPVTSAKFCTTASKLASSTSLSGYVCGRF